MDSRIEYLGPRYFAPRYFGARYFTVTFRPDPDRIAYPAFEDRGVAAEAADGSDGLPARTVAVAAETRSVTSPAEIRTIAAEPEPERD